jgi:hypothetical protein
MAELVRDTLELVRGEALLVEENVVGRRAHGPLAGVLADEEEVVAKDGKKGTRSQIRQHHL